MENNQFPNQPKYVQETKSSSKVILISVFFILALILAIVFWSSIKNDTKSISKTDRSSISQYDKYLIFQKTKQPVKEGNRTSNEWKDFVFVIEEPTMELMNRIADSYRSYYDDRKDRTLFLDFYNHSVPNYYADPDYDASIEEEKKYEKYSIGAYLYNYKNGECSNTMTIEPIPNINLK